MDNYDINRGVLFKNNRKEKETQPTHTGSINIEGKEYYLSAWVNESKSGNRYFSISAKAKGQSADHQPSPQEEVVVDELNDEVPF